LLVISLATREAHRHQQRNSVLAHTSSLAQAR
jgi:hypothetical protein